MYVYTFVDLHLTLQDDSSDSAEQCKFLAIEVEGPRHYFRNARRLVGPTNFKQIVIDEIPDVRVVQVE